MKRLALLAAGAALAATAALAQAPAPTARLDRAGPVPGPEPGATPAPSGVQRAEQEALVDARVAALSGRLEAHSDQQRYWPAVEGRSARWPPPDRPARASARSAPDDRRDATGDFQERLERGSQQVDERAERLKALASAMRPLWTSLDDRQKRLLRC
jgi:hypothetical protein